MNIKRSKLKVPVLVVAIVVITAITSTAVMTIYTETLIRFQVKKAIVIEGEQYINKSYIYQITGGTLYQGENLSKTIKIVNNANTQIPINVQCTEIRLVYKSGYKVSKTPNNATTDWGITVTVTPSGMITMAPKSSITVTIYLKIGVNATISDTDKYNGYESIITVTPVV